MVGEVCDRPTLDAAIPTAMQTTIFLSDLLLMTSSSFVILSTGSKDPTRSTDEQAHGILTMKAKHGLVPLRA